MAGKSGVKAGKAFVLIEAVDKSAHVLRQIGDRFRQFGQRLEDMGRRVIKGSLAAMLPAVLAVRPFVSYDDAMRKVEARSTGTAKEMAELRHQAKELGRTTSFTASQVGELQAKLAQKGFNRGQLLKMTDPIRSLARAAGEGNENDTVVAADLVAGTLRAYKMEASQTAMVADMFSAAVNNSNFSLESLTDGMTKAAPLAKEYNLSLADTIATLASMTNLNIEASSAGVAMNTFFARMSKSEFTNSFNKGLEEATGKTVTFSDAAGNLRKPLDILNDVASAMKGLGTAQKGDLLSILLGVRQFSKGAAAGNMDMKEFVALLEASGGAAARTEKIMDSGLGGSLRMLWSAIEGTAIALTNGLEAAEDGVIKRTTDLFGAISKWIDKNHETVNSVAMVIVGMLAAGVAIFSAGIAMKMLGVAFFVGARGMTIFAGSLRLGLKLLTGVFGLVTRIVMAFATGGIAALLNPVTLIVGAVGLAVAMLWKFNDSIRALFGDISSFIMSGISRLGMTVSKTWSGMLAALQLGDLASMWDILWGGMETVGIEVMEFLGSAWSSFSKGFMQVFIVAIGGIKKAWFNLQSTIAEGILKMAAKDGLLGQVGEMLMGFDGIDVSEEAKKARELEMKRLRMAAARGDQVASQDIMQDVLGGMAKQFQDKVDGVDSEMAAQIGALDAKHDEIASKRKARLSAQQDKLDNLIDGVGLELLPSLEEMLEGDVGGGEGLGGAVDSLAEALDTAPATMGRELPRGLEAGTLEAAQKFAANRINAPSEMKKMEEAVHETNEHLENLERLNESIDEGFHELLNGGVL